MVEKKTDDLMNQLKKENIKYNEYLSENEDVFINNDLSQFWKKVIELSETKKTDIVNKADIGYTFFYDIIKGKKHPSRDIIIKIFIALKIDVEYCQEALRIYEWAALYPKIKRDSILLYAIMHKYSLQQTEELLDDNNEKAFKKQ